MNNDSVIIEVLERSYGSLKAVDGISLNVKKGEMFGLVGPDGAGKTTTIRVMCGLLSPDAGTVQLIGMDVQKNIKKVQERIGYLSQKFSLYGDLTVDENIEFFADIHGVTDYKQRRDELLEFTRLLPFRDRLADKLSGGMKQKLALACSLIHQPEILFLDEPTTGVDPVSRRDFWKILSDLQKNGITIFMTTPYLDEAERCNRVALMNKGKLITIDTPANIKESIGKKVIEIVCKDVRAIYRYLKGNKYEVQLFGDRINLMTSDAENEIKKIKSLLNNEGYAIEDYRIITPSLENVFIHYITGAA
jgi:ABC-2 type transport system ATP-binding protein